MRNEKTSKRVATIAGKILAHKNSIAKDVSVVYLPGAIGSGKPDVVSWSDLLALAASALTQAPNKQPEGFDPREGGELDGRWRPKSAQVRKALRGKLGKRK